MTGFSVGEQRIIIDNMAEQLVAAYGGHYRTIEDYSFSEIATNCHIADTLFVLDVFDTFLFLEVLQCSSERISKEKHEMYWKLSDPNYHTHVIEFVGKLIRCPAECEFVV